MIWSLNIFYPVWVYFFTLCCISIVNSPEGKNDIVAPIFKTKNSIVNKEEFIPRPAAKLQVDNIELTIFKGSNLNLAADIAKVVIRYAH